MAEIKRRLSSRRGSVSAADPYGTHNEHETNRNTSARLTIVRVPRDNSGSESSSPPSLRSSSEILHRRGSGGAEGPGKGHGPARLSFAFSSFTPLHGHDGSGPPSPPANRVQTRKGSGASLGDRPSSGLFSPRQSTLSPQQLFDLAASSTRPPPKSPVDTDEPESGGFMSMPDTHFLPFIDRPEEVAALLSKPPNNRVLALLAQTFPPAKTYKDLPSDPKTWSFKKLRHHLFKVPREECNDADWVHKARTCVAGKSELIWERLKGALGVPPELDYDQEHDGIGGIPISIDAGSMSDSMLSDEPEEYDHEHDHDETWTVEPIFAGSEPIASPLSPSVEHNLYFGFGGAERGMENIGEEQEEAAARQSSLGLDTPTGEKSEPIHGLRISTSAMSATSPRSPMGGIITRSLSSSASFTSSPMIRPRGGSLSREETRQVRDPGNPLFPGSFASLSVGPTFVTSNPSHRSTSSKPSVPMNMMGKRYPRFAARSDDGYSDNAITFVSSDSETSFAAR